MSKRKQTNVTEAEDNVAADQREQSVPEVPVVDEAETETASEESVPVVVLGGETLVARSHPVEPRASDAPAKKGKKRARGDLTLADLAERYVKNMETEGKSSGTIGSYGMELRTALAALGAETPLGQITPIDVAVYFGSDRVTKLKNGKPKSQLSIDKTRRVLRLALVWAAEAKLIAKAPLPEQAATH